MAAAKRKSIAKLCLALGLFVLAGFFRQADRVDAPLPSAAFFLLTNLIYIGLAMGWGFSISRRILHRGDRRWLLLGCAMAVLWLFLRTVKYRFFNDNTVTRYLWYLYYVPQILAPLFSLFAALQLGRRADQRSAPDGLPCRAGRCNAISRLYSRLGVLSRHGVDCRSAAGNRGCYLLQVPRV